MFSAITKIILLTVLLLCPIGTISAEPVGVIHNFKIIRIIDGDTVVISAPFLPSPLKPELSLRVYGVDTPEKGFRGACDLEKDLGLKATEFTKKQLESAKKIKILLLDWDKYGGRILGDVIYDNKSLRAELIKNGFAREYFGDKKKSWCD